MDALVLVAVFIFGLIVGSFLNVVILRYNSGMPISRGRSVCFSCGKALSALELIPVISFIVQRGRCKGCGSSISWRYPAVELLAGVTLLGIYLKVGPSTAAEWAYAAVLGTTFSLLIALSGYDLRHKIIPDLFSFGFAALALAAHLIFMRDALDLWYFLSGPIIASAFLFLWIVTRGRGIGLGDAKLALGIGWLLGLSGGVAATLLAFWIGAAASLFIMALGRLAKISNFRFPISSFGMKTEIPFGPYLVLGTFLAYFFSIDFSVLSAWLSFGV